MRSLGRYALASLGPVGAAGAQFVLSLVVLKTLPPGTFGSFSFLLITVQLLNGVWSALFNAPLLVLTVRTDGKAAESVRAIFATNLLLSLLAAGVVASIALAMGLSGAEAGAFAGYVVFALLRSLGRAHAYAIDRPWRAMRSDLAYSVALLLATAMLIWAHATSFTTISISLLLSAALGLLPLGRTYALAQFRRFGTVDIVQYRPIWREHSGWSLTGVITTEATANAHSYLVTLFVGATAFAPIAATALLIRPIMVATNALMEFERAQMARTIVAQDKARTISSMRLLRLVLMLIWIATLIAATAILMTKPMLIYPDHYPIALLGMGTACWVAVAGVRSFRVPDSALLQAAGQFRRLAHASLFAAIISVALVILCLATVQPIWSILAMGVGELALTIWLWIVSGRLIRTGFGEQADSPQHGMATRDASEART